MHQYLQLSTVKVFFVCKIFIMILQIVVNVCLRVDVCVSLGKLPLSRYSCGTISFGVDKAIISALDTKIIRSPYQDFCPRCAPLRRHFLSGRRNMVSALNSTNNTKTIRVLRRTVKFESSNLSIITRKGKNIASQQPPS